MLADGDARAMAIVLRTVAEAVGGMTTLAEKTGLSHETLYRTLPARAIHWLDTLFGLGQVAPEAERSRRLDREQMPLSEALTILDMTRILH